MSISSQSITVLRDKTKSVQKEVDLLNNQLAELQNTKQRFESDIQAIKSKKQSLLESISSIKTDIGE